jgi:hypothetical protein
LEFVKDQDNGRLFAIIHALKELVGMQAQPAARMAAHINVLQQAAAETSYRLQSARESRDLSQRLVAFQAAYDLATLTCSNAHNAMASRNRALSPLVLTCRITRNKSTC